MTVKTPPPDGSAATRFRKGESGNPKGRPRKTKVPPASPFSIFDEKLTVEMPEATSELGLEAAMLIKTYQRAITGSRRAQKKLVKMILQREAVRLKGRKPVPTITVRREHGDPKNAFEALELLGIASWVTEERSHPNRGSLALHRWPVEAALKRLKPDDLAKSDLALIANTTHDGINILWPKGFRYHE